MGVNVVSIKIVALTMLGLNMDVNISVNMGVSISENMLIHICKDLHIWV